MVTSSKKKPAKKSATPKRVIERPKYKSLRLSKRIKHENAPLMGSFRLMKVSIKHLLSYKRLFIGIAAVYFLLSVTLVYGIGGSTNFTEMKMILQDLFQGQGVGGQLLTGLTLVGVLLGEGAPTVSESGSVYQSILLVVVSLVVIWALRQTYAKIKITVKTAFYKSMTPLVPFMLIIMVIGLQFLPLIIGTSIYSIVSSQGIAVTLLERVIWGLFTFFLALLSLYMISSSVFALYIITLPDIMPMQALRSARELVRHRRWMVMRKILFMPFALMIIGIIIMIPTLLYMTSIAQPIYTFLTMLGLVVAHGYMYRLYRELL